MRLYAPLFAAGRQPPAVSRLPGERDERDLRALGLRFVRLGPRLVPGRLGIFWAISRRL